MVQIFERFLDILKSMVYGLAEIWKWLTTPWFTYGETEIYPLMIFSFTGLMIVAAVMLIKFLNPLN